MVSLTTVVFLACAYVAIEARGLQQACMKIRKGSTAGFKHFVRPIILPKEQLHWEMTLPICPSGPTVGVDAQACADDQIPSMELPDNSTVALHRSGDFNTYTVVVLTLYCDTPQPRNVERLASV